MKVEMKGEAALESGVTGLKSKSEEALNKPGGSIHQIRHGAILWQCFRILGSRACRQQKPLSGEPNPEVMESIKFGNKAIGF